MKLFFDTETTGLPNRHAPASDPSQPHLVQLAALLDPEHSFGDYASGRHAWLLANVRQLEAPIAYKGALSLWEVPSIVEAQIRAQLNGEPSSAF